MYKQYSNDAVSELRELRELPKVLAIGPGPEVDPGQSVRFEAIQFEVRENTASVKWSFLARADIYDPGSITSSGVYTAPSHVPESFFIILIAAEDSLESAMHVRVKQGHS